MHTKFSGKNLHNNKYVQSYLVLDNWAFLDQINGALHQCIQVNSLGVTKPGTEGSMEITLNYTGIASIAVVVHNEGQLYNTNYYGLFGSDSNVLNMPLIGRGLKYKVNILQTQLLSIDQPDDRCGDNIGNQSATACIMNYLRYKLGCHLPIQLMEPGHWPPCNKSEQFRKLMELGYQLEHSIFTESRMHEVTGCLSPCEKARFCLHTSALNKS